MIYLFHCQIVNEQLANGRSIRVKVTSDNDTSSERNVLVCLATLRNWENFDMTNDKQPVECSIYPTFDFIIYVWSWRTNQPTNRPTNKHVGALRWFLASAIAILSIAVKSKSSILAEVSQPTLVSCLASFCLLCLRRYICACYIFNYISFTLILSLNLYDFFSRYFWARITTPIGDLPIDSIRYWHYSSTSANNGN